MNISRKFNMRKSQYELDFVDIDPNVDMRLFLDPYFISKCDFPFAIEAHSTIRSFFEFLLALLRGNRINEAHEVFSYLGESNDVCFGMSRARPQGHGMGPKDTEEIFGQLLYSRAIQSGLMEDIEDFRIFVPNVDKDKVSDMTTNIIKKHLIEYTKQQCSLLEIPLSTNVPAGMYWNSQNRSWENEFTSRLIVDNKPILLVPKRIVSFSDKYTPSEYKQHFVLNFLQNENLRLQTSLIGYRRDGTEYVTKKSIKEAEGIIDKEYLARFTEQHPEVFRDFKRLTSVKLTFIEGKVLDNIDVNSVCEHLINQLRSISPGSEQASDYHNLMVGILELLFYPNLSSPKKEVQIHERRKRIDITYNNSAETGFFFRIPNTTSLTCQFVFVECKNYIGEIANPELDQLSGRFSNRRGKIGILACRQLEDEGLFIRRCADTYKDDRGLIIPITDDDIITALSIYPKIGYSSIENIIVQKYQSIVLS